MRCWKKNLTKVNVMTLEDLIKNLNPQMHQQIRRAIELGHWPDGRKLSNDDKEICMQALIAYEAEHLPEDQRIGYIPEDDKGCLPEWLKPAEEQPIKWEK